MRLPPLDCWLVLDPGRFRESSDSIFLRRDWSLPAKDEDWDREMVEREMAEWYRGRVSSSGLDDGVAVSSVTVEEDLEGI